MEICKQCSMSFIPCKPTSQYCSRLCANRGVSKRTAVARGNLLRGRGNGRSYRKRNGRHEHRIIAEQIIGRSLSTKEVVHHIDGNKLNNHPGNIAVLVNQGEHARRHHRKYYICQKAGCSRTHVARAMCRYHYNIWRKAQNLNSKGGDVHE